MEQEALKNKEEVASFYDQYSGQQANIGINIRHYVLINRLIDLGLKRDSKVLEIGCGIGTLTGLINDFVTKGKLVATDISSESVEVAKRTLKNSKRIEFVVSDMTDFSIDEKFDFVVFPDVLEHIPMDQHNGLFNIVRAHMHDNSKIMINIPHPKAIDEIRRTTPELMQVIDQAIPASHLINNLENNDLHLVQYNSYSLHNEEYDYVSVIAIPKIPLEQLTSRSKMSIILEKQKSRFKFKLRSLFS